MRIGEVAAAGGVSAKTVRFYERVGLLAEAPRSPSGYRDFPPEAIARLRFIRRAQAAGLSLAEIGQVLEISDAGRAPCARVAEIVDGHLAAVRRQIAELRDAEAELAALALRAARAEPRDCGVGEVCSLLEG